MMIKKIAVILFVFSLLSACNWDQADPGKEIYTNPTEQNFKTNKNGVHQSPIVKRNSGEVKDARQLVKLAEQVEGVEYARSIVSGIYSVVGAKVKQGYDKDKTVHDIYEKVNEYPVGANTVVTTDAKHLKQLEQMGNQINQGGFKPNIYNDLGIMISQIKPNDKYPTNRSLPSKRDLDEDRIKDMP